MSSNLFNLIKNWYIANSIADILSKDVKQDIETKVMFCKEMLQNFSWNKGE